MSEKFIILNKTSCHLMTWEQKNHKFRTLGCKVFLKHFQHHVVLGLLQLKVENQFLKHLEINCDLWVKSQLILKGKYLSHRILVAFFHKRWKIPRHQVLIVTSDKSSSHSKLTTLNLGVSPRGSRPCWATAPSFSGGGGGDIC